MPYVLVYTKRAAQDIRLLDRLAQKRLAKKLLLLQQSPLRLSRKLINSDVGSYRYRVGNYRIVFDLVDHQIVILRVGHRREIDR